MKSICYVVDATRTPIGSYGGSLSDFTAVDLAVATVNKLAERFKASTNQDLSDKIDEINVGNVISAGMKQAPARQVAVLSGLKVSTRACTLNKVCGSGMEAIRLTANAIMLGDANLALAGGMESMSSYPYMVKGARFGLKMGHSEMSDILLTDGLTDAYSSQHMGVLTDKVLQTLNVSREAQDDFAKQSYLKAQGAIENGIFSHEICPLHRTSKKGTVVIDTDEEPMKGSVDKLSSLRPVFTKDGTITAGNASSLNDGAAMLLLASQEAVDKYKLKPLARIVGFSSVSEEPAKFSIAPISGIKALCDRCQWSIDTVDCFEINEAFSGSSVAINEQLELKSDKVNIFGGAVALGHPIGASGARVVVTLLNALHHRQGKRGIASLCIGGGEAISMAIERL